MSTIISDLKTSIKEKDAAKVASLLNELEVAINSDNEVLAEFLKPTTITELHQLLREDLEINPRLMQVRRRVPQAKPRAMLFIRGMKNGVASVE